MHDHTAEVLDVQDLRQAPPRLTLAGALQLWMEITGVEPRKDGGFKLGELEIWFLNREIQESLDLDSSEITGRLLLSFIVQQYFQDRKFSVDELLNEPARVAAYLAKSQELASYLRGPDVADLGDDFAQRLGRALDRYDALTPEVRKIVEHRGSHGDRGMLAVLRRDAMRTLAKLEVHQFLDGEPEASDVKPTYGPFLFRWTNINSMLRAMTTAPSGVTVNMIMSPGKPYGVYFAFAIRHGGRLFVFTDREATPHPLAEGMCPRPDKILADRANRHWFPYDVAGLRFDEEGRAYIETSSGKSIVPYQTDIQPVKPLAELAPPQVIWLTMMLDLIVERFWRQEYRAPQLSYTGEMVRVATPLLEAAQEARLPVVITSDTVLSVERITTDDVHSDVVREEDVGRIVDYRHRWLEERYRGRVLAESLDIVAVESQPLRVTYEGEGNLKAVIVPETQVAIQKFGYERDHALQQTAKVTMLDPELFGTREQLQRDRLFIARSNYAAQINALAVREFDERQEEVVHWVRQRVRANLPALRPLLGRPEVMALTQYRGDSFCDRASSRYDAAKGTREFVRRFDVVEHGIKEDLLNYTTQFQGRINLYRTPYKGGLPACHFTGAQSQWLVRMVPENAQQLAFMCGATVEELPDVLQHWNLLRPNVGNQLLDRVDPLLWQLQDPWCELSFALNLFVSRTAMKQLEADATRNTGVMPDFLVPA